MKVRIRWRAVFAGFLVTALCALVVSPVLERIGLQLKAGPVDMLSMLSILVGGFVAGRLAGRFEGMHGAIVAVLFIFFIRLSKQVIDEIQVANALGLKALGKVDSWGNFGQDFFHFIAGALGGLWATPFNERDRHQVNSLLRSSATVRRRPIAAATVADDATAEAEADVEDDFVEPAPSTPRARKKTSSPLV